MTDAMDESAAEGGCLCGEVRYRVTGKLRDVVNCHCSQCRRTHGHYSAYTAAPPGALTLIRDRGLRWYRSSDAASRGFCTECGASLFWKPASGDYVSIAAGTLESPSGLRTVANIFCADAADYYAIEDGIPAFAGSNDSGRPATTPGE